jgi:hypothetical protein
MTAVANALDDQSNSAPFQAEGAAHIRLPFGAEAGANARLSATPDALQRFLDELDKFRQDHFAMALLAVVFMFMIGAWAWASVKMVALKKEYAKHWEPPKGRNRGPEPPSRGQGDDDETD